MLSKPRQNVSCRIILVLREIPQRRASAFPYESALLGENVLRTYRMNAHASVHQLSDVDIDRYAGQHIGVIAAQVLLVNQEVDHVAHCEGGRFLQVRTEAHADVGGGGLGSRPQKMLVLVNNEPECSREEGFESGDIDFTVALSGVAVANFKERALGVDGNVECSAGDQLLVIDVARVHPRWRTVDAAGGGWRRITHAAKEGGERNVDTRV